MTEVDSHVPVYKLEENDLEIIISIYAPLSKPKEAALLLEKGVFTFDSPPYLLKLKLPHPVSRNFSQPGYNSETRTYLVKLKKNFKEQEESDEDEIFGAVENSKGENPELRPKTGDKQFYGFANSYSNMFGNLYDEFSEVINVPDPDGTDIKERRRLRIQEENEKWSDDHYLADTMETDHLESIFQYKPPWAKIPLRDDYTSDERQMLDEVVHHPKLKDLSPENVKLSECQLVDILFCYSYNKRTTEGDHSVESGWTINKLSGTLSWFEVFEDLKTVLLSCYRRSLIYPLFRNWNLVKLVHEDVVQILKLGPQVVTRSLLEVREIFNESDIRYILNVLYVNDLCGFAYYMSQNRCTELSAEVGKIVITKYEVHTDLPLLEIAAHLTLEEEENSKPNSNSNSNVKNIIHKIAGMKIDSNSSSESSEESSDSEDSDSNESDKEVP